MKVVTPPAEEPLSLSEVKSHLRLDFDDDDSLLTGLLIPSVRQKTENYLWSSLMTQTIEYKIDKFVGGECISLPSPPVQSIESIKYIDADGVEQTLPNSDYMLFSDNEKFFVEEGWGKSWPEVRDQRQAVVIRYISGYSSQAMVPFPIKSAMLLLIGNLYENREQNMVVSSIESLPFGYKELLSGYCLGRRT